MKTKKLEQVKLTSTWQRHRTPSFTCVEHCWYCGNGQIKINPELNTHGMKFTEETLTNKEENKNG